MIDFIFEVLDNLLSGFTLTRDNRRICFLRHSREVDLWMGTFK